MKRTKKLLALILALLLLTLTLPASAAADPAEENNTVYLAVDNYGLIVISLNPEEAPITVANFKTLVNQGFYDGLIFHRVEETFVIQGGSPNGTGIGGNTDKNGNEITIKGEFALNGVANQIKHVAGTISMARSSAYDSASSQFFIVTETNERITASLDGKYAAFGHVTEGMDVVKAIAATKTDRNARPLVPVRIAVATFDRAEAEAALEGESSYTWLIVLGTVFAVILVGAIITATVVQKKKMAAKAQKAAKPVTSNRQKKGKKRR